jgi:hypothetical protein
VLFANGKTPYNANGKTQNMANLAKWQSWQKVACFREFVLPKHTYFLRFSVDDSVNEGHAHLFM